MNLWQAILLGLVQGITEFLPVSSSGHLAIFKHYLGIHPPLFFDVCVHMATLSATLWVFRDRVWGLIAYIFQLPNRENATSEAVNYKTLWIWILISSFITGVIGLMGKSSVESVSTSVLAVAALLALNAFILFFFTQARGHKSYSQLSLKAPIWIGLAQCLALFPGISRSGSTLAASLTLGLQRPLAGEYAFLISIPAIFGAFLLTLKNGLGDVHLSYALVAFATSFLSGLLSLRLLLRWIKQGQLRPFAYYSLLVSLLIFAERFIFKIVP